jgi:Helix-turn-helix
MATNPWLVLRKEHRLSIRELERRSGIHRGRLSVIERGLAPTPDEARRILEAMPDLPERMETHCPQCGHSADHGDHAICPECIPNADGFVCGKAWHPGLNEIAR